MKPEHYWPVGIATILGIFIIFLISFFLYAKTIPINLVSEQYYENGMSYQQHIDRLERARDVFGQIDWQYRAAKQEVLLRFPESSPNGDVTGTLHFYRPSSSSMDFTIPLDLDEQGRQLLSIKNMKNGFWRVNISWQHQEEAFLAEASFTKK